MDLIIKEITKTKEKEKIAKKILNDLTEWFGLPESTEEYINKSKETLFLACFYNEEVVGFISLKTTSKDCAEIFVMGIKKKFHRNGIGRKIYEAYELLAKKMGFTYSQVKTVKPGIYKEYDMTNDFYISMGYKELECFPNLWDKWNPCQIYIKYIGK